MGSTSFDQLHKPKTRKERRRAGQAACREQPCGKVAKILDTGKGSPPCCVCVYEGRIN